MKDTPQEKKVRKQFEKWMSKRDIPFRKQFFRRAGADSAFPGFYRDLDIQRAWEGWLAASEKYSQVPEYFEAAPPDDPYQWRVAGNDVQGWKVVRKLSWGSSSAIEYVMEIENPEAPQWDRVKIFATWKLAKAVADRRNKEPRPFVYPDKVSPPKISKAEIQKAFDEVKDGPSITKAEKENLQTILDAMPDHRSIDLWIARDSTMLLNSYSVCLFTNKPKQHQGFWASPKVNDRWLLPDEVAGNFDLHPGTCRKIAFISVKD